MTKIGLITGDGNLPIYIGNSLKNKNFDITYLLLSSVNDKSKYKNENHLNIDILSVKKIINLLNKYNIKKIIFAGSLKRPSIRDLGFDLETIKLAKDLLLEKKGDDNLLLSIRTYLEKKGFSFFNWKKFCPDLFSIEDNLSKYKPSNLAIQNLNKAKVIYKYFRNADIGQSLIIQNQLVLGLEAIEGTDNLIKRCFNYKRKGDKGILFKFSKKNQSSLIDIPLIGLNTIKNIKKYKYEGIYLEKNKCLIVDKDKIIEYANKNKIFISSTDLV